MEGCNILLYTFFYKVPKDIELHCLFCCILHNIPFLSTCLTVEIKEAYSRKGVQFDSILCQKNYPEIKILNLLLAFKAVELKPI